MITRPVLSRAIGRLRLMSMFPGSDADVLAALGAELADLCENAAAVDALVGEIVRGYERWPGIKQVRETARHLEGEREAAENTKRHRAECRHHEAECPGFEVSISDADKTVNVCFCRKIFETRGAGYYGGDAAQCRRGEELMASDPGFVVRTLAEELAKRPGYESLGGFLDRLWPMIAPSKS